MSFVDVPLSSLIDFGHGLGLGLIRRVKPVAKTGFDALWTRARTKYAGQSDGAKVAIALVAAWMIFRGISAILTGLVFAATVFMALSYARRTRRDPA